MRAAGDGALDPDLQAHFGVGVRQLKSGKVPRNRRNLLEFLLRVQTLGLGYMPSGIPTIRAFRPGEFTPEDGPAIAAGFRRNGSKRWTSYLVAKRDAKFGIQACGECIRFWW